MWGSGEECNSPAEESHSLVLGSSLHCTLARIRSIDRSSWGRLSFALLRNALVERLSLLESAVSFGLPSRSTVAILCSYAEEPTGSLSRLLPRAEAGCYAQLSLELIDDGTQGALRGRRGQRPSAWEQRGAEQCSILLASFTFDCFVSSAQYEQLRWAVQTPTANSTLRSRCPALDS